MTNLINTIRVNADECWVVERFISDVPQMMWQPIEEDWFDGIQWAIEYQEFFNTEIYPKVPYQFVMRCASVVC